MYIFALTLHVIAVMLVIGTLFVQSLSVVFRLRLSNQVQIEGIQFVQRRVHRLIYYPVLAVAVASGAYLAVIQEWNRTVVLATAGCTQRSHFC